MPIHYKIDQEINLLYTLFFGSVVRDDAFGYADRLNEDPYNIHADKTLVVLKESNLIFNIEDVETFSRKIARNTSIKYRSKIAILIESPTDTVAATIYTQTLLTLKKDLAVEIFYTLDAALRFLDLTEHKIKVEKLLQETPQNLKADINNS